MPGVRTGHGASSATSPERQPRAQCRRPSQEEPVARQCRGKPVDIDLVSAVAGEGQGDLDENLFEGNVELSKELTKEIGEGRPKELVQLEPLDEEIKIYKNDKVVNSRLGGFPTVLQLEGVLDKTSTPTGSLI